MRSLDTNIVLRWLLDDVPKQTEIASSLIESDEKLLVQDIVFFEIVYILQNSTDLDRVGIAEVVDAVFGRGNLVINRQLMRAVFEAFVKHGNVSFADCYLAVNSGASDHNPLLTFDKALAKKLPKLVELV